MNHRFPFALASLALVLSCTATTAAATDFQARSAKLSYVVAKDSAIGQGVSKFAEIVAKKTGGKMKVRGFPDGQLGAEVQSISAAQGGVLEMAVVSTAALAGAVPDFGVFDLPYLFDNEREADAVLDGPVGTSLLNKLAAKNLVGLCYWEYGFRHVINSKRPINKMEDLRGLKLRTIQNAVFVDSVNGMGANATPMPFTEIYTALESRALDGAETTYTTIETSKFHEVTRYGSSTKHMYGPAVAVVSGKFWDKLSEPEQTALKASCAEARDYERKLNRELEPKLLAKLKASGMAFNELPPQELARLRESLKPVVEKHTKAVGEDLVQQVRAELEKLRRP